MAASLLSLFPSQHHHHNPKHAHHQHHPPPPPPHHHHLFYINSGIVDVWLFGEFPVFEFQKYLRISYALTCWIAG